MFESLHYRPKKISEVNMKTDRRISVLGKVAEVKEDSFVLDDKSGKIEIFLDNFSDLVKANKLVRVFCSVVGQQLKADVVQDLNGFDIDLFNRVEELYKKKGV